MDIKKIEDGFKSVIEALEVEDTRCDLTNTARNIALSYEELFQGMSLNPVDLIKKTYDIDNHNIVAIKNINFYSMCEHHFLPFFGSIDVFYIPENKILGFGDVIKIIDIFSKRPQIQERLSEDIAQAIMDIIKCRAVLVEIRAKHLCMTMRGAKRENVEIFTSSSRGDKIDKR